MIDTYTYNIVSGNIFKKDNVRKAVFDVVYMGMSAYRSEQLNKVPKGTLLRHVDKYKKEEKYLKKLGVIL